MPRVVLAAAAAAIALLASASTANATCYSSTASSQSYADSPADGELGLAPEITGVRAGSDASCGFSVEPVIYNTYGGDLIDGEAVATYVDTDGNAATGSSLWNGADRVVITVGALGADYAPGVGTWNGSTFDFVGGAQLPGVGIGGWKANVDQLGITSPVNVTFRTGAIYEGIYDVYSDFAPEVSAPSFVFPLSFSTTAPAPPPPPPTPPQTQTPTTPSNPGPVRNPGSQSEDDELCRVPSVKGKTASSAARSLRGAGCIYEIRRVYSNSRAGRVISTSPRAGKRTDDTVTVKVSRGRRPKKRHAKVALDALASVESKISAHQEALQR